MEDYLTVAQSKIAQWKETATTNFYWALDVERDASVVAQIKANQALSVEMAKLQQYKVEREELNSQTLATMAKDLGQLKLKYEKDSQSVLESHDRMSVAGLIYEDVVKQVDADMQAVQQVNQQELSSFGFQSKIIFNLSMTVDALKSKVRAGLPYHNELATLRSEVDKSNDIAMLAAPISGPLAKEGMPTHDQMLVVGKETAESLLRATHGGHAATTTRVAQTFFHKIKFETPAPVRTAAETHAAHHHHHHKLDKEQLNAFSTDFFDSINQRDYAEALRVADEATARLPPGSRMSTEFLANVDRFRAGVVPMMLAQNLFDYCDASLISTRYSFVEPVLDKILANAQAPSQQQQE